MKSLIPLSFGLVAFLVGIVASNPIATWLGWAATFTIVWRNRERS